MHQRGPISEWKTEEAPDMWTWAEGLTGPMFDCTLCDKCYCKTCCTMLVTSATRFNTRLISSENCIFGPERCTSRGTLKWLGIIVSCWKLTHLRTTTFSQQFSERMRPHSPSRGFVKHVGPVSLPSQHNHLDTITLPWRCSGSFRGVVAGRERSLKIKILQSHQS